MSMNLENATLCRMDGAAAMAVVGVCGGMAADTKWHNFFEGRARRRAMDGREGGREGACSGVVIIRLIMSKGSAH